MPRLLHTTEWHCPHVLLRLEILLTHYLEAFSMEQIQFTSSYMRLKSIQDYRRHNWYKCRYFFFPIAWYFIVFDGRWWPPAIPSAHSWEIKVWTMSVETGQVHTIGKGWLCQGVTKQATSLQHFSHFSPLLSPPLLLVVHKLHPTICHSSCASSCVKG